jgi:hypothetical protein
VFGKKTVFDFERHRRIEHYGRITSQTAVICRRTLEDSECAQAPRG